MSKSIKFKNNTYLDSKGIMHNRTTLYDILNQDSITLTFNTNYIYTSDLDYFCFKIGKIAFVQFNTVAFKTEIPSGTAIISGFPKPSRHMIGYLIGGRSAAGTTFRFNISESGNMFMHYSNQPAYGDSANKQYCGTLIYKTKE